MARFAQILGFLLVLLLGAPVTAQDRSPLNTLIEAMAIPEILEIMQAESIKFGAGIGADMLPDGGGESWQAMVADIHTLDKMRATVERGMAAALTEADIAPLIAFFTSDTGQRIVGLEVSARRAFLDKDIEAAARRSYLELAGQGVPLLAQVTAYIELNDLVEYNVVGTMNANYWYYLGLNEGGVLEMSEEEMLSAAWEAEDETRSDTGEWLYAYLMLAYAPLETAQMESYVTLSKTAPGRALNQALFAGFDDLFNSTSYALGLAVAGQLRATDL